MKSVQLSIALATLAIFSGTAGASSMSLNPFTPKVMPVLVQVNSQGKVTSASPAMELSPKLARLLRANLDEMISAPATDKHGRPRSSQMVIYLRLNAAPRANGNYDAKFAYVSAAPVPPGSWYWVHIDGYRVALASQNTPDLRPNIIHHPYNRNPPVYQPGNDRTSMPQINSSTPAPAPAPDPGHGR